ncbi:low-density lipoprotein receptor-related protein 10-like isoform X1 [Argiope bruennichi]|uniref:low-density lipoprotein receptor-related protein 10-like isoform X1 n=1 Tax=Argiope bruennichi TaxID=94029 RepID=UPI0024955D75|nr:low-density lipoprotein receptor-related protein 10-like isoform X1 [Argiope bruennichi]
MNSYFRLYLSILGILIFITGRTQCVFYAEDFCTPDDSKFFEITVVKPYENEISFTENLKATRAYAYSTGVNCTLRINGIPSYDIILSVMYIRFRPGCGDYLLISDGNKQVGLCGSKNERDSNMQFYGKEIQIHYFTEQKGRQPLDMNGFTLSITLSKKSNQCYDFRCENNYCINARYVCDGINNCGDFSDEIDCQQIARKPFPGTVVVIAMFLVSVMGLVCGFCISICMRAVWRDLVRIYLLRDNRTSLFCCSRFRSRLCSSCN